MGNAGVRIEVAGREVVESAAAWLGSQMQQARGCPAREAAWLWERDW